MTPKHLLILLLALFATSVAQSDDELHIPVENDNQFPPENHSELEFLEGSGAGTIEEPLQSTTDGTEAPVPLLEDVQLSSTLVNNETETTDEEHACPTACVCNIEGDSDKYVVDCSNAELTQLPTPLDSKITEINLHNNKLTEIPQAISELKKLKILNVNNNEIMDIKPGSISELPELISLKLGNNRLIEYPTDLKNSFGLTKLEELDLGGNDMRTVLTSDTFLIFKALKKLTLPSNAADLADDVCVSLKESLQTVCTGSCSNKSLDCPDAPPHTADDDLLDFVLPGLIAVGTEPEEYIDPVVSIAPGIEEATVHEENVESPPAANVETKVSTEAKEDTTAAASVDEPSFRSAVIQASDEKPAETGTQSAETTVKPQGGIVEATTSNTKTGGVDKSLIGIIVAGMVVVVAGITIKKNWSSIRKRFNSSPRNANERTGGATTNGTTPEEVPLQEKSPV